MWPPAILTCQKLRSQTNILLHIRHLKELNLKTIDLTSHISVTLKLNSMELKFNKLRRKKHEISSNNLFSLKNLM